MKRLYSWSAFNTPEERQLRLVGITEERKQVGEMVAVTFYMEEKNAIHVITTDGLKYECRWEDNMDFSNKTDWLESLY